MPSEPLYWQSMLGLIGEGVTDAVLVERARQADHAAFAALYQRHARYLAGVVYRLMGDDTDLDDIVQETFVQAASALPALVQPELVRTWLVTIAVRRAHRYLGRRRRRWSLLTRWAELGARDSDPADRGAVDDLYDALDRLPREQRVPWVLHRIEQFSLLEVAEACDVSLATVKRRIAEAERRIERTRAP
jgi:RNA polymerase sigma-70 factor, ECF subfamily